MCSVTGVLNRDRKWSYSMQSIFQQIHTISLKLSQEPFILYDLKTKKLSI